MLDALNNFSDKRNEVELYFDFLRLTQESDATLNATVGGSPHSVAVDADIKRVLKANTFLILYNLVEATVRDGIRAIYTSIRTDRLTYAQVRADIQRLWVKAEYGRHLKSNTASHDTYTSIAKTIIDEVVTGPVVAFWPDYDAGISGNLDARYIRQLAQRYGFSARTGRKARGGAKLLTVKTRRNDLAHGAVSFISCGRDYPYEELVEIKDEVVAYLADILGNIREYIGRQDYAVPSSASAAVVSP